MARKVIDRALAPLSRTDAERLLPRLPKSPIREAEKLLRGRCLRLVESFEPAWNEITALAVTAKDPRIRARAQIELVYLAYYLVHPDEGDLAAAAAEPIAADDPLMLADLHIARSVLATGSDRIADAFKAIAFAQDALRAAPRGRGRDLTDGALQRQLAHLHVHSANYAAAREAARAAERLARRTGDAWESRWAVYVRGFAEWAAGDLEAARRALTRAERSLRGSGSSLWRWTLYCLAAVEAELGFPSRAVTLAQRSGYGTKDALAYLALRTGDLDAATTMLGSSSPVADATAQAVRGLVLCESGERREGLRALEDARVRFSGAGLAHDALACALHWAYWQERARRGSGAPAARAAFSKIVDAGGEGFKWYDARVARWLVPVARRHHPAVAEKMTRRAMSVLERASPERSRTSALRPEALRERGLTDREVGIVVALRERTDVDRDGLARRLGMSPNTLRVHLTRIRSKLGVGAARGDTAILAAARGQETSR